MSQRQFFVCRRISIDVWPLNDKFSWGQLKNWVLHYQNTLKFDWFNLLILFLILFLILLAPQDSIFLLSSWKLVIQWPHIYAHRPAQHNLPLTPQTESAAEYIFESERISKQVWLYLVRTILAPYHVRGKFSKTKRDGWIWELLLFSKSIKLSFSTRQHYVSDEEIREIAACLWKTQNIKLLKKPSRNIYKFSYIWNQHALSFPMT